MQEIDLKNRDAFTLDDFKMFGQLDHIRGFGVCTDNINENAIELILEMVKKWKSLEFFFISTRESDLCFDCELVHKQLIDILKCRENFCHLTIFVSAKCIPIRRNEEFEL